MKKLLLLTILFLISVSHSSAQQFGDPSFYLIDSLDLSKVNKYDRKLLDTNLTKYHNTSEDTSKLSILAYIVDRCWDSNVWPKYNRLIIEKAKNKLTLNLNSLEENKYMELLAGGVSNVGYLYDEKGDILNALDYYHKGLYLYERINKKAGIATNYNNLGVIYSLLNDSTKALEYHKKSLKIKKEIGDYEGAAMSYNNIGTIYENFNQPFIALEYFEAGLKINQEIGYKRGMAMCYDNIGDIYSSQDILGKALEYYKKGQDMWRQTGIKMGISTSHDNIANILLKMGNIKEAKIHAIEAYQIADDLGFPMDIENAARTLKAIYELEGNYEKALEFSNIYIEMREKVRNEDNAQSALKKSMQYEYQKEALKDSLEFAKEREVSNLKLKEKETQAYALYGGIGLMSLFLIFGIKSYQQKKRDNKKINEQKREVESQKKEIEKQHITLASTHKEISDSISYAKRIQDAILPEDEFLEGELQNSFVFYRPKDVVSGDFYWLAYQDNLTLLAVADCTGHGVPGAMVSVVCHNALNRVVREFKFTTPSEILDKTRDIIIETFASTHGNVKDGMDISICAWDRKENKLQWAGANNPLYIIRNGKKQVEVILANKQPIGQFENIKPFDNHLINLYEGDQFYLFSDGFMDQFGGENGKKYKYSKFREFLIKISNEPILKQGKMLEKEFDSWKGELEQLDDVCVLGVRV